MTKKTANDVAFEQFHRAFDDLLKSNKPIGKRLRATETSIVSEIAQAQKVRRDWIPDLFACIPEYVFELLYSDFGRLANAWNLDGKGADRPDGILLAHSLSPLGDSIFLLADVGRAKRVASTLNLQLDVLLAGPSWSRHNWNVADFGEDNLAKNLEWRTQLYESAGGHVHVCDLGDIPDPNLGDTPRRSSKGRSFGEQELARLATDYVLFSEAVFGAGSINKKLTTEERDAFLAMLDESGDVAKVLNTPLFRRHLRPELLVIENVLRHFRILDQRTFLYFLAQRYHQYQFSGHLKVAIVREQDFDAPFYSLDQAEFGRARGIHRGLYFSDYLMLDEESGKWLSIHPYCFPSGTAYTDSLDLQKCRKICLHLDDLNNKDQVCGFFKNLPYPHSARMLSDFLSFLHFYSLRGRGKLRSDIRKELNRVSPGWARSWMHYARSEKDFRDRVRTWPDLVLSRWCDNAQLPYYYYPYLLLRTPESIDQIAEAFAAITNRLTSDLKMQKWVTPAGMTKK